MTLRWYYYPYSKDEDTAAQSGMGSQVPEARAPSHHHQAALSWAL